MSAFVYQNDIIVSKVKPSTPIKLFANDLLLTFFSPNSQLVNAETGEIVWSDEQTPNLMGNISYNISAPATEGRYIFYPDISEMGVMCAFLVDNSAPDPWEQTGTNWLMIGGIALAGIAVVYLIGKKISSGR
jgi:hypothetical protein